MAFKSEHCYEAVPLNDLSALTSFTNLFDTLLPTAFDDQLDTASNTLVRWFLFCLVWTIGGAVDSDGSAEDEECNLDCNSSANSNSSCARCAKRSKGSNV